MRAGGCDRNKKCGAGGGDLLPVRSEIVGTGGAMAVQGHVVIFEAKSGGGESANQVFQAAFDLEDLSAGAAEEVVVMGSLGRFVEGRAAGDFDGEYVAALGQGAQGSIHGGQAQTGAVPAGGLEDVGGRKGPMGLVEDLSNGTSLGSVSFHAFIALGEKCSRMQEAVANENENSLSFLRSGVSGAIAGTVSPAFCSYLLICSF